MDSRWFSVFCCLCFASNVIFKDLIINFRGAQARFFQQLNMGFDKGSSSQARQGGLGWLGKHKQTRGGGAGRGPEPGTEKGHPHCLPSSIALARECQGRNIGLILRSNVVSIPLLMAGFSFPAI